MSRLPEFHRRAALRALAAALLPAGVLGSGCAAPAPLLRIGTQVWPGYELLYLARELGMTPRPLRLVEFPSAQDVLDALKTGSLEGAGLTLDEVLQARAEGCDLRVVAVLDVSHGADVLLLRRGLEPATPLRGLRVGLEASASALLLLEAALAEAGLVPGDVRTLRLSSDEQVAALAAGRIDAVASFEPFASRMRAQGAVPVFDSSRMGERIVDVLAVRADVLDRQPAGVRALVSVHFQGLAAFEADRRAAAAAMRPRLQLSDAELLRTYDGLRLPGARENRAWLAGTPSRLEALAAELGAWMRERGLLEPGRPATPLADARFLPKEIA